MIDLHAHVVPGIDDGPRDEAGALALLEASTAAGVTTIACTPHCRADHPNVRPHEVPERVERLRLAAAGSGIELVSGGEVDLEWAGAATEEALRLVSYGAAGHDLLIESPYGELAPSFEERLFALTVRGSRILLAHPERNPTFRRDPARLARLAERGTLLQVTAATLADPSRASRSARFARAMVQEGLAHVIASDAHGADGARAAGLAAGVAAAARLASPAVAEWMVIDAPAAILAGRPLPARPAPSRPARGLRRVLRR